MGAVISITFTLELLGLADASNFPIYLGFYFIANGILTFRLARADNSKSGSMLSAVISIIGGLVIVIAYPFSAYRATMIATDAGRVVFGLIAGVIGMLELLGKVRITSEPIMKQMPTVLGGLLLFLGVLFVLFPINWISRFVAVVWTILVASYMFFIAHKLRNIAREAVLQI